MGVPEYQQILFEDDNPIVPLGPMVGRNVSKMGEYHALEYIIFVTSVLCLLYTFISEIRMVCLSFLEVTTLDSNEFLKLVTSKISSRLFPQLSCN